MAGQIKPTDGSTATGSVPSGSRRAVTRRTGRLSHHAAHVLILLSAFLVPLFVLIVILCLGGCEAPATTRIDAASSSVAKQIDRSAPTHTRSVTVTPATQPAPEAPALPPLKIVMGDSALQAPAGSAVTITESTTGEALKQQSTAQARGASLTTSAAEANQKFDASAPSVGLGRDDVGGSARASGGETDLSAKLSGLARSPGAPLILIGGVAVLIGAIAIGLTKSLMPGAVLIAGGVLVVGLGVMAESYPWLIVIGALIIVGLLVWWAVSERRKQVAETTVTALAGAVDATDDRANSQVRDNVARNLAIHPLGQAADALIRKLRPASRRRTPAAPASPAPISPSSSGASL